MIKVHILEDDYMEKKWYHSKAMISGALLIGLGIYWQYSNPGSPEGAQMILTGLGIIGIRVGDKKVTL